MTRGYLSIRVNTKEKRKRGLSRPSNRHSSMSDWGAGCLVYGGLAFFVLCLLAFMGYVFSNSTMITTTGIVVGKHYDPAHTTTTGKTTVYDDEDYILDLRTERNGYIAVEVDMNTFYLLDVNDQIRYSYRYGKWGLGGKYDEKVTPY